MRIKAVSDCYGSSMHMASKKVNGKKETDKEKVQIKILAATSRPSGLLWIADRFGIGQPSMDMMEENEDEHES